MLRNYNTTKETGAGFLVALTISMIIGLVLAIIFFAIHEYDGAVFMLAIGALVPITIGGIAMFTAIIAETIRNIVVSIKRRA